MQKSIKVKIADMEYSLLGENEELIRSAASEVNKQLDNLRGKTNESPINLSLLAALNIAEKYCSIENQAKIDLNYLIGELEQMAKYLKTPSKSAITQAAITED